MDVNNSIISNIDKSSASGSLSGSRRGRVINSNHRTPLESLESLNELLIGNNMDRSDDDLDKSSGDKSVRFSRVVVRDYSLCLGDNPSVSRGVPISIDWGYDKERTFDINNYECNRCALRRTSEELKLPSLQRIKLLKDLGYSRSELNEQAKKIEQVRQKRFSTRRRVELEDRWKDILRNILKTCRNILQILKLRKGNHWPRGTKIEKLEEETLGSSLSSRKSDISATEPY